MSRSPLLQAVADDNESKVRSLLADGTDVNAADKFGQNSIHLAAINDAVKVFPLLAAAGEAISTVTRPLNSMRELWGVVWVLGD